MPLAEQRGRVTRGLELLRDRVSIKRECGDIGHGAQRSALPLEALNAPNGINSRARSILPGHQRSARGLAVLAVVIPRELQPLGSKPVNVRRLVILAAVGRGIRPTEIVRKNENDVGSGGRGTTRSHKRLHEQRNEQDGELFQSGNRLH